MKDRRNMHALRYCRCLSVLYRINLKEATVMMLKGVQEIVSSKEQVIWNLFLQS